MAVLLDTISSCATAVAELLTEEMVAVDIEGVDLCRSGEICIIQVYSRRTNTTYLFDVVALGKSIFTDGKLGDLLQSNSVRKVIVDGRADNDALYHLFGVKMVNAFDLQILQALRKNIHNDTRVKGLGTIMDEADVVPNSEKARIKEIKAKGKILFAPERGGSYDVWKERPLKQEMIDYSACDVRYLLDIFDKWHKSCSINYILPVERRTKTRIDKAVNGRQAAKGRHMSTRDFELC